MFVNIYYIGDLIKNILSSDLMTCDTMANAHIKLFYFDGRGRGELARLIMAAAGKEFEDIRFNFEEWPKYKPETPYGQAPALSVDGVVYGQSVAINAFLAREFGFYGKDSLEILKIDEIVQLWDDFVNPAIEVIFHSKDEKIKEEGIKKIKEELAPRVVKFWEQILEKNGTGFFVGNHVTLADLLVFEAVNGGVMSSFLDIGKSPLIQKNVELVRADEKIASYMATRKDCPW
ncbi:Glutathione S-transferase 4 [Bulinus truncatus]|nr:Glutathione S-transferase 4 [Bulinus truncatus]